jgi:hypothetical protein
MPNVKMIAVHRIIRKPAPVEPGKTFEIDEETGASLKASGAARYAPKPEAPVKAEPKAAPKKATAPKAKADKAAADKVAADKVAADEAAAVEAAAAADEDGLG